MRAWVIVGVLATLGCRGINECAGVGSPSVELGLSDGITFIPLESGDAIPVGLSEDGEPGLELGVRTHGLDTTDAVTVTLALEVEGHLRQLVGDTELACDSDGSGRLRVFGPLPRQVQDDEELDGSPAYLQADVIDARDRSVPSDEFYLTLEL